MCVESEGADASRGGAAVSLDMLQGMTAPVIPGACIELVLKLLIAPVAIVCQKRLHVQTPCMLRNLHKKTTITLALTLYK